MSYLSLDKILRTYHWHDSYYDLYPKFSKPLKDEEECLFDSREAAMSDARDLQQMLDGFSDPLPVYRVVSVKDIEDLDLKNPGWSWSWEEESALGFAALNGLPKPWVLMRGYASKKDVDWLTTLRLYHEFSGGGVGDSENEIRIPGQKVRNIKAKIIK